MKGLQRIEFRIAYSMALADGELSADEEKLLSVLATAYGFDETEAARLKEESARIDMDSLKLVLPRKGDRMAVLEAACLVAMADGMAHPEEWKLSVDLCRALNLDRQDAQVCVKNARRRLIALAREHGLEADLKRNLKKAGVL